MSGQKEQEAPADTHASGSDGAPAGSDKGAAAGSDNATAGSDGDKGAAASSGSDGESVSDEARDRKARAKDTVARKTAPVPSAAPTLRHVHASMRARYPALVRAEDRVAPHATVGNVSALFLFAVLVLTNVHPLSLIRRTPTAEETLACTPMEHAGATSKRLAPVTGNISSLGNAPLAMTDYVTRAHMNARCATISGHSLRAAHGVLHHIAGTACAARNGLVAGPPCVRKALSGMRASEGVRTLGLLLGVYEAALNTTATVLNKRAVSDTHMAVAVTAKSFGRKECVIAVHESIPGGQGAHNRELYDELAMSFKPAEVRDAARLHAHSRMTFIVNPFGAPDDVGGVWCSREGSSKLEKTHLYPDDDPHRRTRPTWVRVSGASFDFSLRTYHGKEQDEARMDSAACGAKASAPQLMHLYNYTGAKAAVVHWALKLNEGKPE